MKQPTNQKRRIYIYTHRIQRKKKNAVLCRYHTSLVRTSKKKKHKHKHARIWARARALRQKLTANGQEAGQEPDDHHQQRPVAQQRWSNTSRRTAYIHHTQQSGKSEKRQHVLHFVSMLTRVIRAGRRLGQRQRKTPIRTKGDSSTSTSAVTR